MYKAKTKTATTSKKNNKSRIVTLLGDRFRASSTEFLVPDVDGAYYSVDVHGVTKVEARLVKHNSFDAVRIEIVSDGYEGPVSTTVRLYADSLEAVKEALANITVDDTRDGLS